MPASRTDFPDQVFALSVIVMLSACILYAPVYALLLDEPVAAAAVALSAIPCVLALAIYKRTRQARVALHGVAAASFAIISFLVIWQGGLSSPAAGWLVLMPIPLVTAGDIRGGLFWFVLVMSEMVILGAIELAGIPLPYHRGENPQLLFILCQPGLCVVVFMFLLAVGRARHDAKQQLERRNAELSKARDLALAASQAKTQFLANISHEIRTPMNGVLGATEYLSTTSLGEEQSHFVQIIRQSGESLLALLNDVLEFSRIEAGKIELESVPFSPREIVEAVAELLAPKAAAKGLELTCSISRNVPAQVRGDPARVRQILVNLLGNAVKFTGRGEVAIEAITQPGRDGRRLMQFIVRDSGIGIDQAAQSNLFRPFVQADGSTTRPFGGSGLGLAISADLTRLMGGSLRLESEPGVGSLFYCSLPFEVSKESDERPRLPSNTQILLIEPHARTHAALVEMLAIIGGTVHCAPRLEEPTSDARSNTQHVLLIADTALDSPEQLQLLQRWSRQARILLLAHIGKAIPEQIGQICTAVLRKPVRFDRLIAALTATTHGVELGGAATETASDVSAHVLLAEDNQVNQQIALALLKRLRCSVDVVADGVAAIEAWRSRPYDLVLMDCQMPTLDGYDATRAIRKAELTSGSARTPIIAVTANAMTGDREQCIAAGMDDHIPKPYNLDVLKRAIETWVQRSARPHASRVAPSSSKG
ncbi:MAG TPA: response regulator [Burkholderiales bacterium]|nr:response regulator [Burkholderiales bacterium]